MKLGLRVSKEAEGSFSARVYNISKSLDIEKAMDRGSLVLMPVTDKNGHRTKRWMSPEDAKRLKTGKDDGKGTAKNHAGNKKKPGLRTGSAKNNETGERAEPQTEGGRENGGGLRGGDRAAIGDTITGRERGTGNSISGKVIGSGKDGATILSDDGSTHAVEWKEVEGPGNKSKKYIDPGNFNAAEWKKQWDDPRATPDQKGFDYILGSFGKSGAEIADKIRETEEKLKGRPQTWQKYRISGEGESARYAEDREKLHGRIMQELLSPDKLRGALPPLGENPTFMILGGRGGSGKSWFKNNVYDPSKFVILDADEIKAKIPEFEGWNAQDVHEESSDILEQMLTTCIKNGLNVVLDGTMKTASSALAKIFRMKAAGYRTEAHYMHLPRQDAAKRAIGRFKNGGEERPNGELPEPFAGRYVPIDIILKNTTNEDSFDQVKGLVDKWSFRDNNVEKRGDPPIIISEGEKKVKKSFAAIVKELAREYT